MVTQQEMSVSSAQTLTVKLYCLHVGQNRWTKTKFHVILIIWGAYVV